MYEADMETAFIQCVTSYLQYFKTYFGLAFQLIECQLFRDKSAAHLTIQSAVQKITLKKLDMKLQLSPFLLRITETNKSYIDRFYMRIVQYLQYRLNSVFKSNEIDPKFQLIVNQFMNSLHKIFKTIISQLNNKDSNCNLLLGNIFYEVEHSVKRMFQAVFGCMEIVIGAGQAEVIEEIRLSRSTVEEHILGPFYSYLMSFIDGSQQDPEQKVAISSDKDRLNQKTNFDIRNHYRSKSQFNIETLNSSNSKSLRQHRFLAGNRSQQNYSNKTQLERSFGFKHHKYNFEHIEKGCQLVQKKSHKNSYTDMLAIMEIQAVQVYSREYIMDQLKAKNVRNKQMISKFIKLYKKKPKKKLSLIKKEDYIKYDQVNYEEEQVLDDVHVSHDQDKSVIQNRQNIVEKLVNIEDDHNFTLKEKIIAICSNHSQQSKHKSLRPIEPSQLMPTQKHTPNPRLQSTIKQLTMINPIVTYHSQFETNKDAFLYKQGEKLCFEQLRHKMNLQFQKVSSPLQFKKEFPQLQALKKLGQIPGQKCVSEQLREKPSQQSLSKRTTIKGSNFSSFALNESRNNSKSYHSNSEMLQKNHSLNSNFQTVASSSLECSSFQKVNPKHLVIKSILQNQQISRDSRFQALIKMDDKIKRSSEMQNQMVALPRIFVGSVKKNYNKMDKL